MLIVTRSELIIIALEVMGKGMLGIFIALSIIFGMIMLLTKVFPPKAGENKDSE